MVVLFVVEAALVAGGVFEALAARGAVFSKPASHRLSTRSKTRRLFGTGLPVK